MTRKVALPLVLWASLATALPAFAEQIEDGSASTIHGSTGARVVESQGGFKLVTHGVWQVSPAPPTFAAPAPLPQSLNAGHVVPNRDLGHDPTSFRRSVYLPHVYAAEAQYQLPPGLLDAMIWTESRYNPLAVSSAGAAGLGQLMPETARELGVANRFDPKANLMAAARYMRQLLDKFGVVHLAVAAYNAGPRAVERAGGIPRNRETPGYVRSVLSYWGAN